MDAPPIQFVTSSDGVSIAYGVTGAGQVLLVPPFIHSHVQLNWQNDLVISRRNAILCKLAERFRVVTFDNRGQGLSSRGLSSGLTLDKFNLDTEAVASQIDDATFVFVACARAGHLAVRYTVRHPERVAALVLITSQVSMQTLPSGLFDLLPSENWEFFLQTQLLPGLSPEDVRSGTAMLKQTATPADYRITWDTWRHSDISDLLPQLRVPTLVLHAREFPFIQPEAATEFASRIQGATLAMLDGYDIFGNADQASRAIEAFLADLPSPQEAASAASLSTAALSRRQAEVLRLIGEGRTNREIAGALVVSERTVERHVADVYTRIDVANRAQAAVYAKEHGIV